MWCQITKKNRVNHENFAFWGMYGQFSPQKCLNIAQESIAHLYSSFWHRLTWIEKNFFWENVQYSSFWCQFCIICCFFSMLLGHFWSLLVTFSGELWTIDTTNSKKFAFEENDTTFSIVIYLENSFPVFISTLEQSGKKYFTR